MEDDMDFRGQKILVTGGAGFVGSAIAHRLVKLGAEVTVLDDLSTGNASQVPEASFFILGSVYSPDVVDRAMAGKNIVVHAAVRNMLLSPLQPVEDCKTNINGTLNVLMSAEWAGTRVLYTSSASVYGDSCYPSSQENDPLELLTPYAVSKAAGEAYVTLFNTLGRVKATILRYTNIYGSGQSPDNPYCGVVSKFIRAIGTGKQVTIHGDGTQIRDFTYIDDAVEATLRAMTCEFAVGKTINIGSSEGTNINELARTIAGVMDKPLKIGCVAKRPIDNIWRRVLNISKARALLNWSPQIGLEDGLRRTVEYLAK